MTLKDWLGPIDKLSFATLIIHNHDTNVELYNNDSEKVPESLLKKEIVYASNFSLGSIYIEVK